MIAHATRQPKQGPQTQEGAAATDDARPESVARASVFADAGALRDVLDEVVSKTQPRDVPVTTSAPKPVTERPTQVGYQPRPRTRSTVEDEQGTNWPFFVKQAICLGITLLGAVLVYFGLPAAWRESINPFGDARTTSVSSASLSAGGKRLVTKPIEDVRVGDRIIGRNPIREQAELVEPDPATWRKISLHMTKDGGLGLWIDLLRPLTWVEDHHASAGGTIFLDLLEMGAVGDAEVVAIGPCPEIQPGKGTVVTGTFKHQADEHSEVVHLKLEDQIELTGVTANHPYWSDDRQEFVEVGKLRAGEMVDTEYGLKRVVSITPIRHNGFLYNLETTEHVYRVGSLGTLVHNSCVDELKDLLNRSKAFGGHARPLHIGRNVDFHRARLRMDPNIPASSAFLDDVAAANSIIPTIKSNQSAIRNWLKNTNAPTLRLSHSGADALGTGLTRGGAQMQELRSAVIVLRRNPSAKGGWFLLTAFPE